jgi:glutamate N-acetyltransferase/amino-acid N-acetyltransferase
MLAVLAEAVTKSARTGRHDGGRRRGAGHLALVHITGAPSREAARDFCYAIGHSPLCKTALASGDPYWGRFLSAIAAEASRKDLPFEAAKTKVSIGDVLIADQGCWCGKEAEARAIKIMKGPRYPITIELGQGPESYWLLTTDFDHDYVSLNIDYRS